MELKYFKMSRELPSNSGTLHSVENTQFKINGIFKIFVILYLILR